MIKSLVRAHQWRQRIESGRANSITDRAEQEGVTEAFVFSSCRCPASRRTLIVDGRQPKGLRLPEMLGNVALAEMSSKSTGALLLWLN